MMARQQLLADLWRQTDELLTRTRRQIEALDDRNDWDSGRRQQDLRSAADDAAADFETRPRF